MTGRIPLNTRRGIVAARRSLALVVRLLRQAWCTHSEHLLHNATYAAAVAALAAAVVTRTSLNDLVADLVAGAIAIHRALHRDVTPY